MTCKMVKLLNVVVLGMCTCGTKRQDIYLNRFSEELLYDSCELFCFEPGHTHL